MTALLPLRYRGKPHRVMVFVDGENLSIRYGSRLGQSEPAEAIRYRKDIYVWSDALNEGLKFYELVRRYYYTAAQGDDAFLLACEDELREAGIEAPRVYKRTKDRASKRVDISLATAFLQHAFSDNYDIAVLVSGDEDFVPAVEAVTAAGKVVVLWALPEGLSPALRRAADFYFDLSTALLGTKEEAWKNIFH